MTGFATTTHDPDGRMVRAIEIMLPRLKPLYGKMAVVVTSTTHPDTLEILRATFHTVLVGGDGAIGASRRMAVASALDGNHEAVHYCDLDRIIHWVDHFPEELTSVVGSIADHDYLIIGRTERAFRTHPHVQTETERLTNEVFSLWLGSPVDVAAGSCGLSRSSAEFIVSQSQESSNATDCEWPAIIRTLAGGTLGFVRTEGLEFETADYYPDEIERCGSYDRWLEERSADPRAWLGRVRLTHDSIRAMVRAASL